MLPIEIMEPTQRMIQYNEENNEEDRRASLDLLPETRGDALIKASLQKIKMARCYNRRVKIRPLRIDDLVLRKMESIGKAASEGKLTPNRDVPYKITAVVRPGTYRLSTLEEGASDLECRQP